MTWRSRLADFSIIVLIATFSVAVTEGLPFAQLVENWLSDYRIASLTPQQPQSDDIVIVTITEDTLQLFPYRSPFDRRFLASVIGSLRDDGAKALGIDILFDQATEPDKDAALSETLAALKIPLVVGFIGEQEGLTEDQIDYLNLFVPLEMRAYATLVKDGVDSTVREMYPGRTDPGGHFISGFPLALAGKLKPDQNFEAKTIAWRGAPETGGRAFRKFPAHTLKLLPAELFKDKIVLIGADLSLTDRHRTPLATKTGAFNLIPGVEIHAHALDQLLSGRQSPGISLSYKILFAIVVSALGLKIAYLALRLSITISLAIGSVGLIWLTGFGLFHERGIMMPLIMPTLALISAWWIGGAQGNWREKRRRRFLKDAFSLYMSPSLVKELIADPGKLTLGGERREMTFLFTDVAGFTTLSEAIEPSLLGNLLNTYFNGLCRILMEEGGTVIDFIGDAVFAVFGAPLVQTDHAARAIRCATRLGEFSNEFRQSEEVRRWQWGETRIGVHTGFALVGNFGSDLKFKYAAVGDAVNTGSRLEGLNKHFGTTICLSEPAAKASGFTSVRPIGQVVMKGKTEPLKVLEPMSEEWLVSAEGALYHEAYSLMASGRPVEALKILRELSDKYPGDSCVQFHIRRLQQGETSDIIRMQEK